MNEKNKTRTYVGLVLTMTYAVFKLFGIIDWSWIWVLSPIWIQLLLVAVIFIVTGISVFILVVVGYLSGR